MSSELTFSAGTTRAAIVVKRSARAKAMRLRVDPRNRAILLIVPGRMSERRALAWAVGQRDWIEAALAEIPPPVAIVPGTQVPLYGRPHRLVWRPDQPRAVRIEAGDIVTGGPAETLPARLLRWLRQHALARLDQETREFAGKAAVDVPRVGVGDPVSRWGSCSATGSIRYSWRLILAPEWVRRATVAHEVAHRVHLNHGAAFHALVAELLEHDPAPARRWLRNNGASLHRFGRL
ncbi:MAG TPA: SprT family zinc-dependent metalloprotease [Allosphingosinicella sp.]|nr:SprT family zinc-dependent metalloprotease [Allosphingosinicella sp.]